MPVPVICPQCGTTFPVRAYRLKKSKAICCSPRCMGLYKVKAREERACEFCGAMFPVRPGNAQDAEKRFCNLTCHWRAVGAEKSKQALAEFWTHVQHCEHEWMCLYCCWPWTAGLSTMGYGKFSREGKSMLAHTVAWELWHSISFPVGLRSGHYCDNHPCCNPMHLFVGTVKDIAQYASKLGHIARGSAHPLSTITEEDIPVIFALHHSGLSVVTIAKAYEVTPSAIHPILHRRTWTHVAVEEALITLRPKPLPFRLYSPEEKRTYWRKWFYDHHEECLQAAAVYREENLEAIRAQQRLHKKEWGKEHPEIVHERNQANYAKHPETFRLGNARRRARLADTVHDLTIEQWEEIVAAFKGRCAYCGRKSKKLEQDHLTPLVQGGGYTVANIVPACRSCNAKKHAGPVLKPVQPLLLTMSK